MYGPTCSFINDGDKLKKRKRRGGGGVEGKERGGEGRGGGEERGGEGRGGREREGRGEVMGHMYSDEEMQQWNLPRRVVKSAKLMAVHGLLGLVSTAIWKTTKCTVLKAVVSY